MSSAHDVNIRETVEDNKLCFTNTELAVICENEFLCQIFRDLWKNLVHFKTINRENVNTMFQSIFIHFFISTENPADKSELLVNCRL